jgi:transposase-like protein
MAIKRRVVRYSDEYRRAALARLSNETVGAVAKDLTISPTLIRRWKKEMDKPKADNRKKYTDEFKQKAVARIESEGLQHVANDLKISSGMLSNWRKGKGLKRKKKN